MKAHLLKMSGCGIKQCPKVKDHKLREMKKLVDEAELRVKASQTRNVPLPNSSSQGSSRSVSMGPLGGSSSNLMEAGYDPDPMKKRKAGSEESPLEKAFNVKQREMLDAQIARMFFSTRLSFNFARNPHYKNAFQLAAQHNLGSFVSPGYNKLRTKLLVQDKSNLMTLLEPLKHKWNDQGVRIVSDGWTHPQRRPLINSMAVSNGAPIFLKAVNCEGEHKDKFFIS